MCKQLVVLASLALLANGIAHGAPKLTAGWIESVQVTPGGVVLDPFAGSGTTLVAAKAQGRRAVGIDLSGGCCEIAARRLAETEPPSAAAQIEIAF